MRHWDVSSEENKQAHVPTNLQQDSFGSRSAAVPMAEEATEPLWASRLGRQHIVMNFGDEYDGEVVIRNGVLIPHGYGVLVSACGRHCYAGGFVHSRRDGYGKLMTERFVLWCKWRMDYPDLSSSARLDHSNGDRYSGFLKLLRDPTVLPPTPKPSHCMSKFSLWVQLCAPVRCGWGEFSTAGGDRYFGEWENDVPHGFGCYATREGDRYVGGFLTGKFHNTGVLFSSSSGTKGSLLLSGVRFGASGCNSAATDFFSSLPASQDAAGGPPVFIFDGVWDKGRFCGEGHVTLPNWSRVTAEWRSHTEPHNGEVVVLPPCSWQDPVFPDAYVAREWRECFHWELLLCGASETVRSDGRKACAALRAQLAKSDTVEMVRNVVLGFLNNSALAHTAVKVFRRCFFFFYGTCGRSSEIGAGLGNNPLGWCCLRNAFWGCIHPERGKLITAADLELALLDIFSMTRSLQRWTYEALEGGQACKLAGAGANTVIGRWFVDEVLQGVDAVLLNLYAHAYSDENLNLAKRIECMRGKVTLDDMGVEFARRFGEERLFDSYVDAVHCINKVNLLGQTLTRKLNILAQWSTSIDLSTRLAQMGLKEGMQDVLLGEEDVYQRCRSGSADDLLPIHQYVVSQCSVTNLYAHVRMLADFASEESFMDPSSQDSFRVTTFLICVLTLPRLSQHIRDDHGVLVPASFRIERMMAVIESIPKHVCTIQKRLWQSGCQRGSPKSKGSIPLVAIVRGYVRYWMPHVIERTGHAFIRVRATRQPLRLWLRDTCIFEKATVSVVPLRGDEIPAEVRLLCWKVAGSLLKAVGLQFGVYQTSSSSCPVEFSMQENDDVHAETNDADLVDFVITCKECPLPSFMLHAADVLRSVL